MGRWIAWLALPALLAGCDPCSGVGACGAPRIRYEGNVSRAFGHPAGPAEGVRVVFVRTGGVALEGDSLVASTDRAGRFLLEARAVEEGEVTGELRLHPPSPLPPVVAKGVRMSTTRAPGELRRLGDWKVGYPHLSYQVVLYHRTAGRPGTAPTAPLSGVEVLFRRTGGIAIEPDTLRTSTDPWGHALLRPRTTVSGEVTGDLTVFLLPPRKPFTIRGLKLATFHTERFDSLIRIGVGARLPYAAFLRWEGTQEGVADAEVEFRRTGGVPIHPEQYTARSDAYGTVFLDPAPLESGEVVGDVVVRPPAPGKPVTIRGVRLQTVEDERQHGIIGTWFVPREGS